MVVVMKERATEAQIDAVIARLVEFGMDVHRSSGATRTVLGVVGTGKVDQGLIQILDGVHEVLATGLVQQRNVEDRQRMPRRRAALEEPPFGGAHQRIVLVGAGDLGLQAGLDGHLGQALGAPHLVHHNRQARARL